MDLETENRIAAILLKEAAELRRQAEKEGVHGLWRTNVRGRPNSRFLTATVLGVQQANKATEVNEMWQMRQKELEMDDRLNGSSVHGSSNGRTRDSAKSHRGISKKHAMDVDYAGASHASSETMSRKCFPEGNEGLKDEEVEEFLHSRIKRGRGAVGSRMDETGPYLSHLDSEGMMSTNPDMVKGHVVFGPEKPVSLKSYDSCEDERDRKKLKKGSHSKSLDKKHSQKHKSKKKSKVKKDKWKDKINKH